MGKLQELIELLDGKAKWMTPASERTSDAGRADTRTVGPGWFHGGVSKQGPNAKEFHFREAGVQRFNDTYDWDDDEH